ncbi:MULTISPECIES: hypothetical protein [Paenibacillus]|uniref:hypothetical protein n=1 Tax=Paenibacillus TaxID=44249 RepID=UPI0011636A58|nr:MULTISPECIES: hypothetical protein [Paenibacillus]AWP25237.1 hypothetical protein B9D94_00720 [Paenibacillus sp. Cedars]MBX4152456.1 hypothetical protein [Paenibacillus lautus]
MKISNTAIKAFNAGIRPSFNPAVNVRDKRGTLEEHAALRNIQKAKYGVFGGKVSRKDIAEYAYCLG